jgi:hypothetical protein
MSLLPELQALGLDDSEILSLISSVSSSYSRKSEAEFVFSFNWITRGKNRCEVLATVQLNQKGKIKSLTTGSILKSETAKRKFLNDAERWVNWQDGYDVLLRPMFSNLPLQGMFQWKERFRIRPLNDRSRIGKGLNFFKSHNLRGMEDDYLGPPYPFILEVAVPRSRHQKLMATRGIRLLNQIAALLVVLLTPNLTTAGNLKRQWTSIWNGRELSYHLLEGGFDLGEGGHQDQFAERNVSNAPVFSGSDYYNHLWAQDVEIYLPPNLTALLQEYESLAKPFKAAFNRACHWFCLGIENKQSPELAITALSTAVECLLPRESTKKCSNCNKPQGRGPTALFRDHIRKYAPVTDGLARKQDSLYGIRSTLVHGSRAEAVDFDWLSPVADDDHTLLMLEFTARRCLVNWLADPNRKNPTRPDDEM